MKLRAKFIIQSILVISGSNLFPLPTLASDPEDQPQPVTIHPARKKPANIERLINSLGENQGDLRSPGPKTKSCPPGTETSPNSPEPQTEPKLQNRGPFAPRMIAQRSHRITLNRALHDLLYDEAIQEMPGNLANIENVIIDAELETSLEINKEARDKVKILAVLLASVLKSLHDLGDPNLPDPISFSDYGKIQYLLLKANYLIQEIRLMAKSVINYGTNSRQTKVQARLEALIEKQFLFAKFLKKTDAILVKYQDFRPASTFMLSKSLQSIKDQFVQKLAAYQQDIANLEAQEQDLEKKSKKPQSKAELNDPGKRSLNKQDFEKALEKLRATKLRLKDRRTKLKELQERQQKTNSELDGTIHELAQTDGIDSKAEERIGLLEKLGKKVKSIVRDLADDDPTSFTLDAALQLERAQRKARQLEEKATQLSLISKDRRVLERERESVEALSRYQFLTAVNNENAKRQYTEVDYQQGVGALLNKNNRQPNQDLPTTPTKEEKEFEDLKERGRLSFDPSIPFKRVAGIISDTHLESLILNSPEDLEKLIDRMEAKPDSTSETWNPNETHKSQLLQDLNSMTEKLTDTSMVSQAVAIPADLKRLSIPQLRTEVAKLDASLSSPIIVGNTRLDIKRRILLVNLAIEASEVKLKILQSLEKDLTTKTTPVKRLASKNARKILQDLLRSYNRDIQKGGSSILQRIYRSYLNSRFQKISNKYPDLFPVAEVPPKNPSISESRSISKSTISPRSRQGARSQAQDSALRGRTKSLTRRPPEVKQNLRRPSLPKLPSQLHPGSAGGRNTRSE